MYHLKWGIFILLMSVRFLGAQEIDWDKINSNTIFNIISRQATEQDIYHSNIIQIGDYNKTELSLNAKTNITVKQLGDYNALFFNNSFTDKETKSNITAQGNNNIIDITGSNSISEGMQINVKGDNKTVFVRNY